MNPAVDGGGRGPAAEPGWAQALWAGLKAHFVFKFIAVWVLGIPFFYCYFLLLQHPLLPVTVMPVTALDRWIAFAPGALWLYVSLWLYVPLAPGLLVDRRELYDYYRAAIVLALAGLAVFLLWPTASPQPLVDWDRHPPFGPVIAADDVGNALPSLHVAFSVFSGIWLHRLLGRAGAPAWLKWVNAIWCVAIVYSTMATRQHVAVDAVAGALLGWLAALLHLRWRRSRS